MQCLFSLVQCLTERGQLLGRGVAGLGFFKFGTAHGQLDFRPFELGVVGGRCDLCGHRRCAGLQDRQGLLGGFELLLENDQLRLLLEGRWVTKGFQ
ncbi:hypothetical protein D3C80_1829230 [compost metagenome]